MLEPFCYTFVVPLSANANIPRIFRMPLWMPDPIPICRVEPFEQQRYAADWNGDWGVSLDPGGWYCHESGYPLAENTSSLDIKPLATLETRFGCPRWKIFDNDPPIVYRDEDNDLIVFMTEIYSPTAWGSAPYITFSALYDRTAFVMPDRNERMWMTERLDPWGVPIIRDKSIANNQLLNHGAAISNDAPAGETTSLAFDGTGAYISTDYRTYDFNWSQDFDLSWECKTSDASLQTFYRHIFSGGPNGNSAAAYIRTDGKIGVGTETASIAIFSTTNVADGQWHNGKWSRRAGVSKLYIDDALEASAADTTNYFGGTPAAPGLLKFGCYAPGQGHWHGNLKNIRASKYF